MLLAFSTFTAEALVNFVRRIILMTFFKKQEAGLYEQKGLNFKLRVLRLICSLFLVWNLKVVLYLTFLRL